MIALTRLNGSRFLLNSDLILTIESSPDTTVTLINGEKLLVLERIEEVRELVIGFRCLLLAEAARHAPDAVIPASGSAWQVARTAPEIGRPGSSAGFSSGNRDEDDEEDDLQAPA